MIKAPIRRHRLVEAPAFPKIAGPSQHAGATRGVLQ
jgi:hypothetical protein